MSNAEVRRLEVQLFGASNLTITNGSGDIYVKVGGCLSSLWVLLLQLFLGCCLRAVLWIGVCLLVWRSSGVIPPSFVAAVPLSLSFLQSNHSWLCSRQLGQPIHSLMLRTPKPFLCGADPLRRPTSIPTISWNPAMNCK